MDRAAALDTAEARGLVADLLTASTLRRQAAFVVVGSLHPKRTTGFLQRLHEPDSTVGDVLRRRLARDLIAACFEVEPEFVPKGYLRALLSVGDNPLEQDHLYNRLWEIFTAERHSPRANALRYCGPITATTICAVDGLDPVLLHPEIVRHIQSVSHAQKANLIIRFLKQVCSTATDEALHAAARQALGAGCLDRFARTWTQKADRFPPPPFPASEGITPLTSAAAMISTAREFKNCIGTADKIGEVLIGRTYYYIVEHRADGDHNPTRWVVEVSPLSSGDWVVSEIEGVKGSGRSPAIMAAIVRRVTAMGALMPTNPAGHTEARELEAVLGIYHFGRTDLAALAHAE
jgi:hypothetical protein